MNSSKLFSLLIITGICLSFVSCDNAAQKVVNAEENVVVAEEELTLAEEEYLADIAEYKLTAAEKIEANNKSIAEFNVRIEKEKMSVREDYLAKIKELELKNSDMEKKIGEYKVDGKEKWELFKNEFTKDLDDLGKSISDFVKNK